MKPAIAFVLVASSCLLGACTREVVTLPEIDTSVSADGIVALPDETPAVFKEYFVNYTKVIAPNDKPIHILAQDGWTNDQIRHGRDVLEFLLTDCESMPKPLPRPVPSSG